jgi:hypothetical protein
MAKESGTLGKLASKTLAAGREHVAKIISGEETVAEAAGGTVEDLISGPKEKEAKKNAVKKVTANKAAAVKKKTTAKRPSARKKSKNG